MQGANREVDEVEETLAEMQSQLDQHLKDVRKLLGGGSAIAYVPLHKESHVLEIPQARQLSPVMLTELQGKLHQQGSCCIW